MTRQGCWARRACSIASPRSSASRIDRSTLRSRCSSICVAGQHGRFSRAAAGSACDNACDRIATSANSASVGARLKGGVFSSPTEPRTGRNENSSSSSSAAPKRISNSGSAAGRFARSASLMRVLADSGASLRVTSTTNDGRVESIVEPKPAQPPLPAIAGSRGPGCCSAGRPCESRWRLTYSLRRNDNAKLCAS